ncbi:MAG: hypothetical protein NC217_04540 [Muribaculaceae bacterium]|nr:hypothetical protein [Muribaculaceae bacterium]
MTYEEFEYIATHPREDDGPSIFRLRVFRLLINCELEYPSFTVDENDLYFTTHEEALERMKTLAGGERIYCFQLARLPLGQEMDPESYANLWLYDNRGNLLDRSFASSIYKPGHGLGFDPFYGRPDAYMRFKEGEIVEYISGHCEVKVGIILYRQMDFKERWQRVQKYFEYHGDVPMPEYADYSDDIYLVIDEDYECWGCDRNVQSTSILPLSAPLSDEDREKLLAKYRWAAAGN